MVACCTHRHSHETPTERSPLLVDNDVEISRDWRTVSLTASLEGMHRPPSSPEEDLLVSAHRRSKRQRRLSLFNQPTNRRMDEVSRYDETVRVNSMTADLNEEQEPHDHFVEMLVSGGSPIRSAFLIGALSVHSIFEGLALGLEVRRRFRCGSFSCGEALSIRTIQDFRQKFCKIYPPPKIQDSSF